MDRHDLTDIPQHFERLQAQKRSLQDAQSRKGQRPPRNPRMQTIMRFTMAAMHNAGTLNNTTMSTVASSFVPPPYLPCVTPFTELNKISIKDLVLETHHRGKYILARCVTPQDRMTAVLAIVEDEGGDVVLLQIYHQEQADETLEDILTEGAVIIVKEPYLKATSDGNYGIRVDHVSDIEFLAADDDRVPAAWQQPFGANDTAMALKMKGNDDFNATKYRAAIDAYTRALQFSPTADERLTITLNRALAYIKTKAFERALSDIECALSFAAPTEKALYRKAQALYGMRRFRECCEVLKTLRLEHPNNKAAQVDLARAASRLAEQTYGRYDYKKMYAEAAKAQPPQLDHATYNGPVAIRESGISPGGRGLFTTEPVSAGGLLFCEKAFAHAFVDTSSSGPGRASITILIDPSTDRVMMGTALELTNMIIHKLRRNPSLVPTITDLHHGSYEPAEATIVDGVLVVDTFLIRRIIDLNSFGCPRTSRETHMSQALGKDKKSNFHSSGVWPQASYINHSCLSNARRSFIGDMMIARASRDLPADTELTWWYQPPGLSPYLEHQKPLLRTWGFMCKCAVCKDLRDTPKRVMQRREQLRGDFRALMRFTSDASRRPAGVAVLKKAEVVVGMILATYKKPPTQVPRLAVTDLQLKLAQEWDERGQAAETARCALAALESLGYVVEGGDLSKRATGDPLVVKCWGLMMDNVIDCWMFLRNTYRFLAPEIAAAAERYAKTSYRVCIGEDETFDETYGYLM